MAGVSGSNEVLHFLDKPAANERIKLWAEDTKAIHLRCAELTQQRPQITETTLFGIIIECENKSEAMDGVGEWLMERTPVECERAIFPDSTFSPREKGTGNRRSHRWRRRRRCNRRRRRRTHLILAVSPGLRLHHCGPNLNMRMITSLVEHSGANYWYP